jgi:2-polyprenyl-3-methyl-5-hydroxy-6-metoxy-1,4-benzoquinol methylase
MRGVHPKHLMEIREFWVKKFINQTDVVLDLGCGNGQRDFKIADVCQKIIGVDYDSQNIESARKNAKINKIKNIDFIKDNIFHFLEEKMKIQFDKIILLDVLEHIIDRQKLLQKIQLILKDDGLLFISVPNKDTLWKKRQQEVGVNYFTDPDHKIEYSKDEIIRELEKAKFKIIEMNPDVIDTPWAPLFDLIGGFSLGLYKKLLAWKRREVMKNPQETSGWEIVSQKI